MSRYSWHKDPCIHILLCLIFLSFRCTNKSFNVFQGFMATGTLCFFIILTMASKTFSTYGITIIGFFYRIFMFLIFFSLVTSELHVTSNFTKRPWGIATSSESLFDMSIFLYFVLTDCDQLLTSFTRCQRTDSLTEYNKNYLLMNES